MNFLRNRQAKLPEDLEGDTIGSMVTGEVGYTNPWAMWVDTERNCWLHPEHVLRSHPQGNVKMKVELREDGYHVWTPPGMTWSVQAEPGYQSPRDIQYLPVVELHR